MITIDTKKLCDLLADLLETADYRGIHLQTVRGYDGDEPGEVSLLVGTATDGYALGHTWTACSGRLDGAFWPVSDVKAVIAVCKPLAAAHPAHTVDLSLQGRTLVLQETPELFDSGTMLRFDVKDIGDDAAGEVLVKIKRILSGDPMPLPVDADGNPRLDTVRTSFTPAAWEPLIRIAKRRKEAIHVFRSHSMQLHRVQIGNNWIGAVAPTTAHEHDDPDKPTEVGHFGDAVITEKVSDDDTDWLKKAGVLWPAPDAAEDGDAAGVEPDGQTSIVDTGEPAPDYGDYDPNDPPTFSDGDSDV